MSTLLLLSTLLSLLLSYDIWHHPFYHYFCRFLISIAKAENLLREKEFATEYSEQILELEQNLNDANQDIEKSRVAQREMSGVIDNINS